MRCPWKIWEICSEVLWLCEDTVIVDSIHHHPGAKTAQQTFEDVTVCNVLTTLFSSKNVSTHVRFSSLPHAEHYRASTSLLDPHMAEAQAGCHGSHLHETPDLRATSALENKSLLRTAVLQTHTRFFCYLYSDMKSHYFCCSLVL